MAHTTLVTLQIWENAWPNIKVVKAATGPNVACPSKLVFCQEMPDEHHAFIAEQQIKKWSRAKKEALINGNWDLLRWLAKKPNFRKPSHK